MFLVFESASCTQSCVCVMPIIFMACLMCLSGLINGINFTYRAVQLKQGRSTAPLQHIRRSRHLHKAAIKLLLWLHAAAPHGTVKQVEFIALGQLPWKVALALIPSEDKVSALCTCIHQRVNWFVFIRVCVWVCHYNVNATCGTVTSNVLLSC